MLDRRLCATSATPEVQTRLLHCTRLEPPVANATRHVQSWVQKRWSPGTLPSSSASSPNLASFDVTRSLFVELIATMRRRCCTAHRSGSSMTLPNFASTSVFTLCVLSVKSLSFLPFNLTPARCLSCPRCLRFLPLRSCGSTPISRLRRGRSSPSRAKAPVPGHRSSLPSQSIDCSIPALAPGVTSFFYFSSVASNDFSLGMKSVPATLRYTSSRSYMFQPAFSHLLALKVRLSPLPYSCRRWSAVKQSSATSENDSLALFEVFSPSL